MSSRTDHLRRRDVKLGISNLTRVEILSGISDGDVVARPVVQPLAHGGWRRGKNRRESFVMTSERPRPPRTCCPPVSRLLLGAFCWAVAAACRLATPRRRQSPANCSTAGRADEALRLLTPQATGNNAAAFNYLCRVYFALE